MQKKIYRVAEGEILCGKGVCREGLEVAAELVVMLLCLQSLFGIDAAMFESFLTTNESITAGEVITRNMTKEKAEGKLRRLPPLD